MKFGYIILLGVQFLFWSCGSVKLFIDEVVVREMSIDKVQLDFKYCNKSGKKYVEFTSLKTVLDKDSFLLDTNFRFIEDTMQIWVISRVLKPDPTLNFTMRGKGTAFIAATVVLLPPSVCYSERFFLEKTKFSNFKEISLIHEDRILNYSVPTPHDIE